MKGLKGTLLLVDDDPAILMTVGDRLHAEGHEVLGASSADEALAVLARQHPDLIILDIRMPGRSGLSFLKDITDDNGKLRYPVLVFTARAEMDHFFGDIAVDGFLPKTAEPAELIGEIQRVLVKHRFGPSAGGDRVGTLKILIAEDEPVFGSRLAERFRKAGYETLRVANGYAVVDAAVRQEPDAVLLKFVLPEANGALVASMLSTLPSTRRIPVVLYDDSGVDWHVGRFPNVKEFVAGSSEDRLLEAVEGVMRRAAAS